MSATPIMEVIVANELYIRLFSHYLDFERRGPFGKIRFQRVVDLRDIEQVFAQKAGFIRESFIEFVLKSGERERISFGSDPEGLSETLRRAILEAKAAMPAR